MIGRRKMNEIYRTKGIKLIKGDCLEIMKNIPRGKIDMILCDLPYGTTACKWDNVIPFEPLWEQYERVIKDNRAIVLTATQPFVSALIMSKPDWYKHEWIWDKVRPSGFQIAKYKPMQRHEHVLVFSKKGKRVNYFPIMELRNKPVTSKVYGRSGSSPLAHSDGRKRTYINKYPQSILKYNKPSKSLHPTQKPVALLEYLIKTYTNEGDLVLDNCMGSGSTGVAAINTNRKFIGIEIEQNYFDIAKNRIMEVIKQKDGEV
jgi:site-specific DNA-methyltransferase (adenine-specific)